MVFQWVSGFPLNMFELTSQSGTNSENRATPILSILVWQVTSSLRSLACTGALRVSFSCGFFGVVLSNEIISQKRGTLPVVNQDPFKATETELEECH